MARQQRQFPQGKYILRTPRKSQNGQVYAVYLYYCVQQTHSNTVSQAFFYLKVKSVALQCENRIL